MKPRVKTYIFFILFFFLALGFSYAQFLFPFPDKGEVYLKVYLNKNSDIIEISKIVSVDSKTLPQSTIVYAYANKIEYYNLLRSGFSFEILNHPSDLKENVKMFERTNKDIFTWDAYPVYNSYLDMMISFQTDFSHLCKIYKM